MGRKPASLLAAERTRGNEGDPLAERCGKKDRTTTSTKRGKPKKVKLKPAIYAPQDKVVRSADGTYTLYLSFKVRRAVTIGLEALHGRTVVGFTGFKHFKVPRGQLALKLDRQHWPTGIRLVTPKSERGKKSADG